jgi:hypothetical protein
MDLCHDDVKVVAQDLFETWNQRYTKFIKTLESGKFVNRFIQSRVPDLLGQVSFNYGLYDQSDVGLHRCMVIHTQRWTQIQSTAQKMTRAFLEDLSKRCLSMTEIVIVSMLMKIRYFLGDINDETYGQALALSVPHYNPDISWPSVFETMICWLQNPSKITCPEMKTIFQHTIRSILDAVANDPHVFEKHVSLLEHLYSNKWEDVEFTQEQKENLCFGGLAPSDFMHNNGRMLRVLQCYRNFENGDFSDLLSLLLSVQLTIRTSLLLQTRQDRAFFNSKDLKDKFESIKLVRIIRIMNNEPLFELFQYPRSFSGGKRPFVYCEVQIKEESYFPTLELAVLYAMFSSENHRMICDHLHQFLVDDKKVAFQKEASETIEYKGHPMPKKWLKYKIFKDLIQN